jgi:hypothetical protein
VCVCVCQHGEGEIEEEGGLMGVRDKLNHTTNPNRQTSSKCQNLKTHRLWTLASCSASSCDEMKEMARPLVPKRPARPTRCRYVSDPSSWFDDAVFGVGGGYGGLKEGLVGGGGLWCGGRSGGGWYVSGPSSLLDDAERLICFAGRGGDRRGGGLWCSVVWVVDRH